jgi:hypothetical protein
VNIEIILKQDTVNGLLEPTTLIKHENASLIITGHYLIISEKSNDVIIDSDINFIYHLDKVKKYKTSNQ